MICGVRENSGMGILPMRPAAVPAAESGCRARMVLRRTGKMPVPRGA